MQLTFEHSSAETADIHTYYFKPESPIHFTAGQFIELTVPHDNADKRGTKRWFTLSSSPTDDLLAVTTRIAERDGSSYKLALQSLKPGDGVTASAPMGDFVLPKLIQTPLVFVAGGIGITPFLSIFKWLAATGEDRPIKFIQAVRSEDDIAFQDTLDAADQHATIVISEPTAAWGGERGHVTAEMIVGLEEPTPDTLVYVSGPEQLVENLMTQLKAAGLRKDQLIGDYFPGYPAE